MSQKLELPSYANINTEEMAAKIGLNVKHIPILIQSFIDESTQIITSLEAAIGQKDYEEISNMAHSAKGKKEDYPYEAACMSLKNAILSIRI
jgi:HPt (histidine-containing phosphotransfer) domain-containing protein